MPSVAPVTTASDPVTFIERRIYGTPGRPVANREPAGVF
jgi:hypothetical protein